MQNETKVLSIGMIGALVIALSLAAFFLLDVERVAVRVWALAFLLLSELILFSGLISLRLANEARGNVFLKTGITTALSLYFATTLMSVIFAGAFKGRLGTFILIELAIIVFFAIIMIAIFASSRSIARLDEADMAKVAVSEPKRGGF